MFELFDEAWLSPDLCGMPVINRVFSLVKLHTICPSVQLLIYVTYWVRELIKYNGMQHS